MMFTMRSGTTIIRSTLAARGPARVLGVRPDSLLDRRSRPGRPRTSIRNRVRPFTWTGTVTTRACGQRRIGLRERRVGQRPAMTQLRPQFLGDVRRQRGDHQHQRLGQRLRGAARQRGTCARRATRPALAGPRP